MLAVYVKDYDLDTLRVCFSEQCTVLRNNQRKPSLDENASDEV